MSAVTRPIRPLWHTDVLVVGAGSAGCTAAIAAARAGASVALVERYGFLGGTSTQILDTFYGFYTPGAEAHKVVGGVPDLVLEQLHHRNAAIRRPNTYGAGDGITYDPETLKVVWETLALEAGVQLLLHSFVLDVLREGDRITGVVVGGKGGLLSLTAQTVIDASGDADVAYLMGVPYEGIEAGPVQSLTTTFKLLNVDVGRARQVDKDELHLLMADAVESGGYDLPRREGSVHITPLPGVMVTNMTRVADVDATDPVQLTAAEVEGRRQAMEYARFMIEQVPGYEHACLGGFSTQIGIRETRRVVGDYRLTRDDVLSAQKFEDVAAKCGAPIEDHHAGRDTRWEYLPEGETYDIPLRCLLPQTVENLLLAGRCLSAEHDAHASVRSMAQCMAMGQAAGVVAALAAAAGATPRSVPRAEWQQRLRAMGAIL